MEQWSVVSGCSQRVGRKGKRMETVFVYTKTVNVWGSEGVCFIFKTN